MTKRHVKYNPSFLSEAELLANFVVRHADLNLIVGLIGENVTDSNQHLLVIGPHGSGKTTLVHRVAAEIGRSDALRTRWYPLRFAEESYEVVTVGEFWLEALFHLAEQTGDEKWRRTYSELRNETDDQRLAERALGQLLDFADHQGKRILLIVENLNMMFDALADPGDAWKIRHTLLHEPRVMLLATATSRFEQIENASQAMFELFKLQEMKPLDDEECNSIWELIAGKKLAGERIRPIRILTGGNPRLLTIIAKFGAHRSFRTLLDDLVDLIDEHTEYFKSHLDHLPPIERKVYLALAGLWDASTARSIAKAARLDVNRTSSLLGRLAGRGAVVVEEQKKRIKYYAIAERMYNIYYLMRRRGKPSDRVKATVKFMICMYAPESAVRLITDEACRLSPETCHDHYLAFEETMKAVPDRQLIEKIINSTPKTFLESPYVAETLLKYFVIDHKLVKEVEHESHILTELINTNKLIQSGIKHLKAGDYGQGIKDIDEGISKAAKILQLVLIDSKNNPTVIKRLENGPIGAIELLEETVSLLNTLLARFAGTDTSGFLELVAKVMLYKCTTLGLLHHIDEAVNVCDELLLRFADATAPKLRGTVAIAMVLKGFALQESKRLEEAVTVYDELLARFAAIDTFETRELVGRALLNKGVILGMLNRHEDAIVIFDNLVERINDANAPELKELVARAMINKGVTLGMLNRHDDAVALYDDIVARFASSDALALLEAVGRAMFNKGVTFRHLNRTEDSIAVFEDLVVRFANVNAPELRELVAMAMFKKGINLGILNRPEDEVAAYDDLLSRFADIDAPEFNETAAVAMIIKGVTLGQLNRLEEAIAVYDEIEVRFGNAEAPELRESVARAISQKGIIFGMRGNLEEAEKAMRKATCIGPDANIVTVTLIELLLKLPERQYEALQYAKEKIGRKPGDQGLLNGIAWAFYKHGDFSLLTEAEGWSRRAVSISPGDASCHRTLACLLCALGRGSEALESARIFMQSFFFVRGAIEDAIELFVELAASGQAKQALRILLDSSVQPHLEPLVAGLKLFIGEDVKTAIEIREVAQDVVKRIEDRVKQRERFSALHSTVQATV